MIANAATDWWQTGVILIAALLVLLIGYLFGATRQWDRIPLEDADGSGVDRIRCPACNRIKFRGEAHHCPKQPAVVPAARSAPVYAGYDRPVPPPPVPLPPPGIHDPIEARARP